VVSAITGRECTSQWSGRTNAEVVIEANEKGWKRMLKYGRRLGKNGGELGGSP